MDALVLFVVAGFAVLGGVWGAVRMASTVAALVGGVVVGRFAGPELAIWLFGQASSSGARIGASLISGGLIFVLLLMAGVGIRTFLEKIHLSFLDRLVGALVAAALALGVSALLLALAAAGGFRAQGTVTTKLTLAGEAFLAVYRLPSRSANPKSNPPKPMSQGQHPQDP